MTGLILYLVETFNTIYKEQIKNIVIEETIENVNSSSSETDANLLILMDSTKD